MKRTHKTCDLNKNLVGRIVEVAGWVHRRRDHGGLIFIDLRDRWGIVQLVFDPKRNPKSFKIGEKLKPEFVINAKGEVVKRPLGTENKLIPTGEIEILVSEIEILNQSKTPPFEIPPEKEKPVEEELRLKYRYLDLRRNRMKENIIKRHQITKFIRDFLSDRDFLEIETPILTKSTPEGARDFLVPSRLNPGCFYALPQAPQQLKQILMVAGFERYFQIARCFRDEDLRGDRQPEFTQLDLEMSFVDSSDIMGIIEDLLIRIIKKFMPNHKLVKKPFPILTYQEAMETYGTDKPDLRFDLKLVELTPIFKSSKFEIFKNAIKKGFVIKGLKVKLEEPSRKEMNRLIDFVKENGGSGLVHFSLTKKELNSPIIKFLSEREKKDLIKTLNLKAGETAFVVADEKITASVVLGKLREKLAKDLNLIDPSLISLVWIVNFPLLTFNEEEKRWESVHHPFTAPFEEDVPLLDSDPQKVRAKAYDIIFNGVELGGGSIRIHKPELQKKIFKIMGYSDKEIEKRFGHLLKAFSFGAPPHGGIALGLDRLVMLIQEESSIREVIAFPKTGEGRCLLMDAPSEVDPAQLKEVHIRVIKRNQRK